MDKNKLCKAFVTMYEDLVNKPDKRLDPMEKHYVNAKDFVENYYPRLNDAVVEFIAMYMAHEENPSVMFYPAGKGISVRVMDNGKPRLIEFSEQGVIVKDSNIINIVSESNTPQRGE